LLKYQISHSRNDHLRTAFINALATCCFVTGDDGAILDLLEFFSGLFAQSTLASITVKASLNAFGLLFTSAGTPMAMQAFEKNITVFEHLLDHSSSDVRIAAGENIALMFEMFPDMRYNKKPLIATLHILSKESSKHVAKKERASQRSAFRDILKTVEEQKSPEQRLKFSKRVIAFNSWIKIKRLNAIREILGQGLHVHFEENELISDIFGVEEQIANENIPQWREVIDKNSELAKGRTQKLTKDRYIRMDKLKSAEREDADDW